MFRRRENEVDGGAKQAGGGVKNTPDYFASISADGTAFVNGEKLERAAGGAAQTAVLDRLFSMARQQADAVVASVLDHEQGRTLRVMVLPDGSSRLLEPPRTIDTENPVMSADALSRIPRPALVDADQINAPEGRANSPREVADRDVDSVTTVLRVADVESARADSQESLSGDGATSVANSQPTLAAEAAPEDIPGELGPATQAESQSASESEPEPVPVTEEPAPAIPRELADVVRQIRRAVAEHRLPSANLKIAELKRLAGALCGEMHPHMFEALALDAYVAHLEGDQERSTAISLDLAERRLALGDNRAEEEIERAAATWELLGKPHTAVPLGNEIIVLWRRILDSAEHDSVEDDSAGIKAVESRLSVFARVTPPRFATDFDSRGKTAT